MNLSLDLKSKTTLTDEGLVRLQLWIDSAENCPSEVFLFRHVPLSPDSSHKTELFTQPCNYSDLLNYSAEEPDDVRQLYRKSSADLLFTSNKEAQALYTDVAEALDTLLADIAAVTDATPVTSTYDCSGVCDLTISTKDGGSAFSKLCTLTLSSKGIYTENCFFLVRKLSEASAATVDNQELVAIASPEDVLTYGTVESYPTWYRVPVVKFAVDSEDKLTTVLTAIKADLTAATSAFKIAMPATNEHVASDTVTGTPLYGN